MLELTGNLTPDDNFSGRSTTNLGIHEHITLSSSIIPSGISAAQVGGIQWQQNSGNGNLSNALTDGTASYDVADSPESATLQLRMLDGPSKDSGPSKSLTIVAPSAGYARKQPTSGIRHDQYWWSCGFLGDLYVLPDDVSFNNLFFKEEEVGATANGWLSFLNNQGHFPGGAVRIGFGNISIGARVIGDDQIFSGKYDDVHHGAYANGNVNWPIPWKYSVDSVSWNSITTVNQTASSTSTGRCTISKDGSGSFLAELTAISTSW